MEMCREAEVLHTGSSRSSSWVHLNHWTIAWKMCRDSNYTKTWTLYHWRSPGTTMELHTAETSRTSHSFHDSSQHEACTGLKHQDFAACMDVCQSQHLGQCVVPQVATLHKNTHKNTQCPNGSFITLLKNLYNSYVPTHQILPGSRPWYIIARMRQEGLRIIIVFSYLKTNKQTNNGQWLQCLDSPYTMWF